SCSSANGTNTVFTLIFGYSAINASATSSNTFSLNTQIETSPETSLPKSSSTAAGVSASVPPSFVCSTFVGVDPSLLPLFVVVPELPPEQAANTRINASNANVILLNFANLMSLPPNLYLLEKL